MKIIHNMKEIKRLSSELRIPLEQEDTTKDKGPKGIGFSGDGDKNTKCFHACTNQRRKKNTIKIILP